MAEHRVELVKLGDPALQGFNAYSGAGRDFGELVLAVGKKFVERRIEKPDGDRERRHDPENLLEIAALGGHELEEGRAAAGLVLREDHLADVGDPRGIEEHMLGAAQAIPRRRTPGVRQSSRGLALVRTQAAVGSPAMRGPKSPTSSGWRWRRRRA